MMIRWEKLTGLPPVWTNIILLVAVPSLLTLVRPVHKSSSGHAINIYGANCREWVRMVKQ